VDWTIEGTASKISKSNEQAHDGTYSCKFEAPTTSYGGRGVRSAPVAVIGGEEYFVGGWFYVNYGGAGSIGDTQFTFNVEWLSGASVIYTNSHVGWSLGAFDTWEEVKYDLTAPAGADHVRVYVACQESNNPDNNVYIDLFSLSRPPAIDVTSPVAGDYWYVSESRNITWDSIFFSASVDIDYSTDGGPWAPIAVNIPDAGTYSWNIPADPSTRVRVRVQETGGGSVSDQSGLFTIAERDTINLLSPQGGETWYRYTHHDILWSAGPDVGAGPVDLDYSTDSGSSWTATTTAIGISPYVLTEYIPPEKDYILVLVLLIFT